MQTADTPPRWKLNLTSSTYIPIMQYCKVRSTREHLYRAKESLCCKGGKFDNMELMDQILSLRAERATLSKHSCYLNYVLKDRMVKNAQTLEEFFNTLKSSLKQPVLNIRHKLEQLALSDGLSKLESWDIHYYKRILKNENFPFDEQEFRPYFEFQSTMKGVFKLCEELFGIKVEAQGTADAFHPDITVYKVYSKNELKGWLYVDPYARAAKSQGAWALSYTPQSNDFSLKPHVGIHFNFSPPTKTQPSLLVFSDVLTVFHEFGHALHGLLSNVRYPSSEGMNVALDFVELPSQLLENFAWEIPMIQSMASHYQTGEPIPESMLKQLKDSSSYDRDWGAARTAAFALMDKKLHETATLPEDLRKLEAECNEEFGMLPMPEQCYFLPTFDHVFGGEYAAGYYSYLWAEVLDADVFDAYKNSKNPKEFAKTYRDTILSAGSSRKEDESYRILMGREPDSKAFLKRILS
jgi:peptidyl-dipeptidase Dcp